MLSSVRSECELEQAHTKLEAHLGFSTANGWVLHHILIFWLRIFLGLRVLRLAKSGVLHFVLLAFFGRIWLQVCLLLMGHSELAFSCLQAPALAMCDVHVIV